MRFLAFIMAAAGIALLGSFQNSMPGVLVLAFAAGIALTDLIREGRREKQATRPADPAFDVPRQKAESRLLAQNLAGKLSDDDYLRACSRIATVGAGSAAVAMLASTPAENDWFDADWDRHPLLSDDWHETSWTDSSPAFNIDGSPMLGSFDIHGNPYGVTDSHSTMFETDSFDYSFHPAVNIDGSPMVGDLDIYGHPYGVTDSWSTGFDSGYDFGNASNSGGSYIDD